MTTTRMIGILAFAAVAAASMRPSPAEAAGNWHWGAPGVYAGQSPAQVAAHVVNDGIADPGVNYWTPFWQGGSDPNIRLPAGTVDKSQRNEFGVNHDINAQHGIPLVGYLDIFTPLLHTNELAIASTVSSVWNNIVDTVSQVWSSFTSLFRNDYSSYSTFGNYSNSGWDNGFTSSFTGYGGGGCFSGGESDQSIIIHLCDL